jgi:hypothetical protein
MKLVSNINTKEGINPSRGEAEGSLLNALESELLGLRL